MIRRKQFVIRVILLTECLFTGMTVSAENDYPTFYEREEGNVCFACEIELPENFNPSGIYETAVKGLCFANSGKVYELYVDGKNVAEHHVFPPASDELKQCDYYILEDGAQVFIDAYVQYSKNEDNRYNNAGISEVGAEEVYAGCQVDFISPEESIEVVKSELLAMDYPAGELEFHTYPVSAERMAMAERENVEKGLLSADRISEWTEADDAYVIWAYQKHQGMTVFHESMNRGGRLSQYVPNNGPVMAWYSTKGMENISADSLYQFEIGTKKLELISFEQAASVVIKKYNNILSDDTYRVQKAKLFERVYLDEHQKYQASPVWYFEIKPGERNPDIMLVDAVNGKEITLNVF